MKFPRQFISGQIADELDHAYAKHGREPWGRHEFYAILKEEVDELWDAIKRNDPQDNVVDEAIQVAAMVFRYLETGDRYRDAVTWGEAVAQENREQVVVEKNTGRILGGAL